MNGGFCYPWGVVTQTRMTLEEFLALPDIDERRLELIDGEVYEKMSPKWGHSRIVVRLGVLLEPFGVAGVEPRTLIPPSGDLGPSAPLPDLAFFLGDDPADDQWITRPPDLTVELLSIGQRQRDVRAKIDAYIRFGIRSVWVVDLERQTVDIYENGTRRTVAGEELIQSLAIPGFAIPVNSLFERRAR